MVWFGVSERDTNDRRIIFGDFFKKLLIVQMQILVIQI